LNTTTHHTDHVLQLAHQWWSGLEEQWQLAFNEGVLRLGKIKDTPGDDDLIYVYRDAENIRLAGPKAQFSNLSFELTNLSGLQSMQKLSFLSVTDMALTGLKELTNSTTLRNLFVQNNQLTSLAGIEGNKELMELYVQDNALTTLLPIQGLTKLQMLCASRNQLENLDGITPAHADEMRQCMVLPNDKLRDRDILKLQNECGIIARKG